MLDGGLVDTKNAISEPNMGFFTRRQHSPDEPAQKAAVNAVYDLLRTDNALMDRKRLDAIEINESAILVCSWGFDEQEAERKQQHAIASLVACGLLVDDHGFVKDGVVMGCVEGMVSLPLEDNGGIVAITNKILSTLPAYNQPVAIAANH